MASSSAALSKPLMADASSSDPYYTFQEELRSQVKRLQVKHEQWRDVLENTNTATNPDFPRLTSALEQEAVVAQQSLTELFGAVQAVERNRMRFRHIDDRELAARKQFLDEIDRAIRMAKDDLASAGTQAKLQSDKHKTLTMKRKPAVVVDGMSEYERKNEQFLAESKLTQEQLVRRDDVVLDEMHSGLSRLGSAAIDIRTELEGQSQLLDELGEEVDEAQSSLDRVMGQLHKLLKTKDNCQIGIILLLTLVLVGMIALVVFL